MVEVQNVSYRVGSARILQDISLRFRPNRFNVILGPNGAGKSTLLKIATGVLAPTTGEVRYGERPVRTIATEALARTRAVLAQHVELPFPLAVRDVVAMGRYPHYGRVPSSRDREIIERALALVELTDKRMQSYPTLSGGEQQKVQLARVLAQIWNYDDPRDDKVLFLDEPTASLDVYYQLHLLGAARELLGFRCTVVAILHDLNVALHHGDAFFFLEGGRLVQEVDRPDDVSRELIERVFHVRAHRVTDPESSDRFWRFAIESGQRDRVADPNR